MFRIYVSTVAGQSVPVMVKVLTTQVRVVSVVATNESRGKASIDQSQARKLSTLWHSGIISVSDPTSRRRFVDNLFLFVFCLEITTHKSWVNII